MKRIALGWALRGALLASMVAVAVPAVAQEAAPKPPAMRNIFDLRTPMRDGVELSSDVYLPAAEGRYPTILIRTPYTKSSGMFLGQAAFFAAHGYAVVLQDTRGRGDSDGEFDVFFADAADGHDAVEGIAKEPWSNGRVCMMGGSYMGSVQWAAASAKPPHLVCIAPTSPAARFFNELAYVGGAFDMQWALQWLNMTSAKGSQAGPAALADWASIFQHRPLRTMDERLGRKIRLWREFLDHDKLDDYWRRILLTDKDFAEIQIPILTITGTYDPDQLGALYTWNGVEANAPNPENRFLLLGPWTHGQAVWGGKGELAEYKLPQDSIVDYNALILSFFDKYLKQSKTTFDQPRVRVYFTGSNQWRNFTRFPVPEAQSYKLHLASGGGANTAAGNGILMPAPGLGKSTDTFVYDPRNPVPQLEGARLGPVTSFTEEFGQGEDRSRIQARRDVLVYTSPAVVKQLDVAGKIEVELYAASSAKDTDFTASLSDVGPDGKSVSIGPMPMGVIRARFRDGFSDPKLLVPGRPYKFTIDLGHVAHSFMPGHKLRIDISSSAYPLINPNQNTGNPVADDVEWVTARQTIYHNRTRPSAVILPVLGDPTGAFARR